MYTKTIRLLVLMILSCITVPILTAQDTNVQSSTTFAFQSDAMVTKAERNALLNKVIQVNLKETSVEDALQNIARQADLKLMYSEYLLPEMKQITYINREISVYNALWTILEGTELQFAISSNGQLVVMKREVDEGNIPISGIFQETITGTVVDAHTGEALPGVNIVIEGTTSGTITDVDGWFEFTVPSLQETLVFSYIGYLRQVIEIDGRSELNVQLVSDVQMMEDIVVVGYGSQKKVNLTGAISVANSDRLESRSISNAGEGLQGVIPNLNITIPSGDPTDSPVYNIRGYESITGGSPLILVDGIPMDLNRVNPNDIESISVLKDASAAAVYGARAAFGVVLVETKSGRKQEDFTLSLNSQLSMAKPIFNMDPVTDPHEFVTARNKAFIRTMGVPLYPDHMVAGTKAYSENPDEAPEWGVVDGELWFYGFNDYHDKIMTDFAPTQQHDLSISGGSEKSSYYASIGYLNKDGYIREQSKNENFKRYNFLVEAEFEVADWLSLKERVQFNSENSDKPHFYSWDANINSLARVGSSMPIQFPDLDYYLEPGDKGDYEEYIGMYSGGTNFIPYLMDGGRTTFSNNDIWLTQGVTVTPFDNFVIRSDFSFNNYSRNYKDVRSRVEVLSAGSSSGGMLQSYNLRNPNPINFGFSSDDWIDNRNNNNRYYVFNVYGEYDLGLFEHHDIKLMLGFNQEWGKNEYVRARSRSLITPAITDINATVGAQEAYGNSSEIALRGAFYRFNYIFKDKYLLEASGRYDGTSRFPKEDRFGFFPSFSAGWIISNEKFMAGTDRFLDMLKIRGSFGTLGNQSLGASGAENYYPYISTMGIGTSSYIMSNGQIPYVTSPGLVGPSLTWETVTSKNIGLDARLFGGRLDATFDLYTRDTKDMLMGVEYPNILGASAPEENAADLRTSGWELELRWRHVVNKDISYNIGIALSDWVSEITKYINPNNSLSDLYEGKKLGEIWGYETVGIFQNEEEIANHVNQSQMGSNWLPGDIRYADLNGDGVISPGSNTLDDPGDRKVIGNSNPRGSFGIDLGISYKNFRLSTFLQGVIKRDHWPTSSNWTWFFPYKAGHVEKYFITDTWSEENRDAYFPAANVSRSDSKNLSVQTRYLQNAGYIRLKNLTLSYDLPINLLDRIGMREVQVYFSGMNLWEYSPIRAPLDPESIYSNSIVYPMQRTFTLGTRISF